jgi:Heat shock protein 9/12
MSDQARQSFTDKATAAVKVCHLLLVTGTSIDTLLFFQPDSEKSTMEHIGDKIKGAGDSVASKTQPEVNILYLSRNFRNPDISYTESEVCYPAGWRHNLRKVR